jgi:hypothetical protein
VIEQETSEGEYLTELRDAAALVAFEFFLVTASNSTDEDMPRIARKAFSAANAFAAERANQPKVKA